MKKQRVPCLHLRVAIEKQMDASPGRNARDENDEHDERENDDDEREDEDGDDEHDEGGGTCERKELA